jgi:hypothetical protein
MYPDRRAGIDPLTGCPPRRSLGLRPTRTRPLCHANSPRTRAPSGWKVATLAELVASEFGSTVVHAPPRRRHDAADRRHISVAVRTAIRGRCSARTNPGWRRSPRARGRSAGRDGRRLGLHRPGGRLSGQHGVWCRTAVGGLIGDGRIDHLEGRIGHRAVRTRLPRCFEKRAGGRLMLASIGLKGHLRRHP